MYESRGTCVEILIGYIHRRYLLLSTLIYEDSRVIIAMAENPVNRKASRHIDTGKYFIGQLVEDKTIVLEQCVTDNMVTDVLTKGLPTPAFEKHKSEMIGEKSNTCSVYVEFVMVYVQESYWIDLQYHNTTQICDVLIVLLHCKVVRCEYKEERGNTFALFNLERLRHGTGLWARPVIRYRSANGTYR